MNVLKKDIFAKPGLNLRNRKNNFNPLTTGKALPVGNNPLPFSSHNFPSSDVESLSQESSSSISVSQTCSSSLRCDSPPSSFYGLDHGNFEDVMLPFVVECQNNRLTEHSGYTQSPFKKPRPYHKDNSNGRDISYCETTSDVLRVLEDSFSTSISKKSFLSDLTYRAPQNQDHDIFLDDLANCALPKRLDVPHENDTLVLPSAGRTPLSSIRANTTTTTSTDKKTPKTPKTSSTTVGGPSDSETSACIIAITEGRGHASGEVGIAAMDPRRPHLILCQISDSQRYTHSLAKMNVLNFSEAIVPNTFVEGPTPRKLYLDLLERFPSVTINHVQRRHFNEAAGVQMIQQCCSRETESVMVVVKDKFYALAAAAALLKYIEFTQSILIAARSLKIEYQGTDGTTIIDLDTANRLELVMGLVSRQEKHSLLGVLKCCKTKGGSRLLRANLLQPPADSEKINARLDCVTELVENPILCNTLENVISLLKNSESLLSLCMHPPQQNGLKAAQYQLKYTLLLKTTLELVPALSTALQEANSEYFRYVRENLADTRLQSILDRVFLTMSEGTPSGVRGGTYNKLQACFMIRAGINGLLDVAKKAYTEIAQEIAGLVNALKEKHNLPLRLGVSQRKGYHIQISPLDRVNTEDLPPEFILIQKSRNSLTCYTAELVALDQRCQQALHEIELMTNVLLFELLNDIREDISCLFPLCECLAELDVCIAFARVSGSEGYVRPMFGPELCLKEARHPVLDNHTKERIVANDVFADHENNFVILTGPNQSGKSIYIRQIALLQVMAQVGCYVPAKEATFRIADRIFSRIGFDDSIEGNASTLMVEMQDMEFIRNNLTSTSLVVVDELCRGTSVEEGTCLAFVLCEELLDTSAFVFFTTHFLFLTKLQEMYCNVRNYHFETQLAADNRRELRFTHRMLEGVTPAEQYGIRLAELMGYSKSILDKAKEVAEQLLIDRKPQPIVRGLTSRYEIAKQLRMNLPQGNATMDQILPIVQHCKALYEKLPAEKDWLLALLQNESLEKENEKTPVQHSNQGDVVAGENIQQPEEESFLSCYEERRGMAQDMFFQTDNESLLPSSCNSEKEHSLSESTQQNSNLQKTPQGQARVLYSSVENGNERNLENNSSGPQSPLEIEEARNTTKETEKSLWTDENQEITDSIEKTRNSSPTNSAHLPNSENSEHSGPLPNSETTREAAMMLLNLRSTLGQEATELNVQTKKRKVKNVEKEGKKVNKPDIGEWIHSLHEKSDGSPTVDDKALYYQWKYSRNKNKRDLKAVAVATRGPPLVQKPQTPVPCSSYSPVNQTSEGTVSPHKNTSVSSPLPDDAKTAGNKYAPE